MTNFNTKPFQSSGTIVTEAGDQVSTAQLIYRRTTATVPFGGDAVSIMKFTSIMLDKRAPGMFSNALSGPAAKLEWLAELLVASGQVSTTAKFLLQHDLVSKVNERLLRGNARFKQGTVLMSHPALFRAMLEITGASNDRADPKRITARVLTELFARIYTAFNVIMPYRSVYAQEAYDRPVAVTSDLIAASHVATVTETLEALKLGTSMKEKEFSAGVVETILGPVLLNAANKLLAAEKYNRWMRDAATITGMFLRNADEPALESLRDNGNLQILATNASFGFDAMSRRTFGAAILSPVHEHEDILQYAALRLRELRRYETISMDKFANMYSYSGVKTARGQTAGVFISRNLEMTCNAKAIVLESDSDILVPLNSYALDPYMPMLNEFVNAAFSGAVAQNAAHAFSQHVIAREIERDDTLTGGRIVGFNMTEDELMMIACAQADEIIISSFAGVGPSDRPEVFFGVRDDRANYKSDAFYNGTSVYTSEPGEVLILTGDDFDGNQRFTTRPQTYAEEVFGGLVDTLNPDLYNSASRALSVSLPLPDGEQIDIDISLYGLLTGLSEKPELDNFIAIDRQAASIIQAFFALAITAYADLSSQTDPTDIVMAEQVATGTHDLLARFVAPIGFKRFMRTLNLQLMASPQFGTRDKRALLTNMVSQHSLAIRLAVTMMLRMGLIPYGMQSDIVAMLTDTRAIERAATSEAFRSIMNGRV